MFSCYCPQTKLLEGNIFTPVCHSVHTVGVFGSGSRGCVPLGLGMCTPWSHSPPGHPQTHTPWTPPDTPPDTHTHPGHTTTWTHNPQDTPHWTPLPTGHTPGLTHTHSGQQAGSTHLTGMLSSFAILTTHSMRARQWILFFYSNISWFNYVIISVANLKGGNTQHEWKSNTDPR